MTTQGYVYFFTISAFSIMAIPPRSASFPFTVMFYRSTQRVAR
jgi:hypothetical protein